MISEASKRISHARRDPVPKLRPAWTIVSAKEGKDERAVKRDKEGRKANKEESEWV